MDFSFGQAGERGSAADAPQPTAKTRLLALLDYIEHVERRQRKPTLIVPVEFYCAFEEELLELPGVERNLVSEGEDLWLRVSCLEPHEAPPPPELLQPWIVLARSPDQPPRLRDELTLPSPDEGVPPVKLRRGNDPRVAGAFDRYVSGEWAGWAGVERARRKTMAVYDRLFSLHQSMEAEGADMPLELVWGIGMAVWNHGGEHRIAYPLLTQPVEIGLDRGSLALEVRPRQRSPALELEPYLGLQVSAVALLERAWRAHQENIQGPLSPFDRSGFEPFLKEAVTALDPHGQYWPDVNAVPQDRSLPGFGQQLVVTDTWVLFARKRSPNALMEDVERLRDSVAEARELPPGPACFVEHPALERPASRDVAFRGYAWGGTVTPGTPVRDLYFPKPYNAEQVSIIQKLDSSPGVVVQGPPGTGKTHTIANIICHTLAQGGRVLVTSKGEPALAVLRDHIPESLRALSVALLTEEKEGIQQFKRAIHTIAAAVARIDPQQLEQTVAGIRSQVDALHERLVRLDRELAACAASQLTRVPFCGRLLLPAELSRYVLERENEFGWFPDRLESPAENGELPEPALTHGDIDRARAARRVLGGRLIEAAQPLPPLEQLPDMVEICNLHEATQRQRAMAASFAAASLPPLRMGPPEAAPALSAFLQLIEQALAVHELAGRLPVEQSAALLRVCRSDAGTLFDQLQELAAEVDRLDAQRAAFTRHPVSLPADADLDGDLLQAVKRACAGKSPFGVLPFGQSGARAAAREIRVAGLAPDSVEDWEHVLAWLQLQRSVRTLGARWAALCGELQLSPPPPSADTLKSLRPQARAAIELRRLATELEPRIAASCAALFGHETALRQPPATPASLYALRDAASRHLDRLQQSLSDHRLPELIARLSTDQGPESLRMRQFLETELGRSERSTAWIAGEWTALVESTRALAAMRPELEALRQVAARVDRAGAPQWARALLQQPVAGDDDPWTPAHWWEAWHWRQAATFLEHIDVQEQFARLQAQRRETEDDLARGYQSLIEHSTWLQIHRNCPPAVTAALQAYLNAVQHIGKGLGVRAARYRREARAAMMTAHRAVPCWIMPHWRVSETLPSELGQFDLVIVDEASQSDLWALPSLLRGRKLVIVGDDRQVSPEAIGFAEERIRELKTRYLHAQVYADQMTPEKSIYDLARVAFSGNLVMLREHFRCARPIIEFSKREFYRHDLQPLRVPTLPERLSPPLVDVHIKGARRSGNVNDAEARALVNEIKLIIADPRCAGRSIGVVSLLGTDQARWIFRILREEVSAKEILARRITVGDARTFQGKERDIMLLSMVATPEAKMTATSSTFQQRFNVAASRARDQMILFRSVDISDLDESDLKAKLIGHFCAPFGTPAAPVEERERCESAFEREMYDELRSRGYRLLAKVPAGAAAIDLVVEGSSDRRVAIECDGDQLVGAAHWSADLARQRMLERAGWTVCRVFAASFILRRRRVMEQLLATLGALGIQPGARTAGPPEPDTEHRVIHAADILEAPPVSLFSA